MNSKSKKTFNYSDFLGNTLQLAGTQRFILEDGKGKGTSVIRVRNGNGLDFCILPDKAMDVFDIHLDGVQMAWISGNGIVSNSFYDDKGMGWLRSFGGGMLATCGLRNVGPPEDDQGEHFGLHGRISGTPAENVNIIEFWENDLYHIEISGELHETNVFGENLVLKRTFRTNSGSNIIDLHDQIINRGNERQQIMLLYHLNWGFPLLSPKAELLANPEKVVVRGDDQTEVDLWGTFTEPTKGYQERVYFFDLIPDNKNQVYYQLTNKELGKGVKVSWDKSQLPILTEWKMMGKGDYVLGLEPCNSLPLGRKGCRESGTAEFLEENAVKEIKLSVEFLNLQT